MASNLTVVSVRLETDSTYEALVSYAEKNGLKISVAARLLLEEILEDKGHLRRKDPVLSGYRDGVLQGLSMVQSGLTQIADQLLK